MMHGDDSKPLERDRTTPSSNMQSSHAVRDRNTHIKEPCHFFETISHSNCGCKDTPHSDHIEYHLLLSRRRRDGAHNSRWATPLLQNLSILSLVLCTYSLLRGCVVSGQERTTNCSATICNRGSYACPAVVSARYSTHHCLLVCSMHLLRVDERCSVRALAICTTRMLLKVAATTSRLEIAQAWCCTACRCHSLECRPSLCVRFLCFVRDCTIQIPLRTQHRLRIEA